MGKFNSYLIERDDEEAFYQEKKVRKSTRVKKEPVDDWEAWKQEELAIERSKEERV